MFWYEESSDVNSEHKALCCEVCLRFPIGSLSKHRLCVTHTCLIHFLGMIQCGIYVYNIYSSYYVAIFSRDEFIIYT